MDSSPRTLQVRSIATAFALAIASFAACTTPNPNYRKPTDDASVDGSDAAVGACKGGAALRCDGSNLIRCNANGTGEVSEPCSLGCKADALRCFDVAPSNGLAKFLDSTSGQLELNLGDSATIDTDTGEVKAGGNAVQTYSETVSQPSGPVIRVFPVKSLVAKEVVVTGKNALAVVSAGDINISGVFSVSARNSVRGAGAFIDGNCRGQMPPGTIVFIGTYGGFGGGGFGSSGGSGGSAKDPTSSSEGGPGGQATGNAELVPLRGGCAGGHYDADLGGGGGGAIQLVSRTLIAVSGAISANGGSSRSGGSGGGILLEAPIVDVGALGRVIANGAGGKGSVVAEDAHLDPTPAFGGKADIIRNEQGVPFYYGRGGNGGAGTYGATDGGYAEAKTINGGTYGGQGGGGVGRIRVNTASGGIRGGGILSPPPSTGTLATR
jgi:hypothetical protein